MQNLVLEIHANNIQKFNSYHIKNWKQSLFILKITRNPSMHSAEKNAVFFNVKAGGSYSNHCSL
jgi:hypothetical protein